MATTMGMSDSASPATPRRRTFFAFRMGWIFALIFVASMPLAVCTRRAQIARETAHTIDAFKYGPGPPVYYPQIVVCGPGPPGGPAMVRLSTSTMLYSDQRKSAKRSQSRSLWTAIDRWFYPPERELIGEFECFGAMSELDLRGLQYLPHIRQLRVSPADDGGLKHIRHLYELETLFLDGPGVTNEGLKNIANLRSLSRLSLMDSGITDGGMAALALLENLAVLKIRHAEITDAGIRHIRGLQKLMHLDLMGTDVTDATVDTLAQLPRLRYLNACYTPFTREAAERLRKSADHEIKIYPYLLKGQ